MRPADTRQRVYLALKNADLVSVAVARAVADGAEVDDLVVLLMDVRDPVARALAVAIVQRSSDLDLGAEEARVLGQDKIPTAVAVVPVRAATVLLQETHPGVAQGIRLTPPHGRVRVVAVGEGGATLVHLPMAPIAIGGNC